MSSQPPKSDARLRYIARLLTTLTPSALSRQFDRADGVACILYLAILCGCFFVSLRFVTLPVMSRLPVALNDDTRLARLIANLPLSLAVLTLALLFVKHRGDGLESIGLSVHGWARALLLGVAFGMPFLVLNFVIGAGEYHGTLGVRDAALTLLYFVTIGLIEEIPFRGYLQSRLAGLVANTPIRASVVAFAFSAYHVPFKAMIRGISVSRFVASSWLSLIFAFLMHFYFLYIYRRTGSILAPITTHAVVDFSNEFFTP